LETLRQGTGASSGRALCEGAIMQATLEANGRLFTKALGLCVRSQRMSRIFFDLFPLGYPSTYNVKKKYIPYTYVSFSRSCNN
jgi:hypothetical protein